MVRVTIAAALSCLSAGAMSQGPAAPSARDEAEIAARVRLMSGVERARLSHELSRVVPESSAPPKLGPSAPADAGGDAAISRLLRMDVKARTGILRTVDKEKPVYPVCLTCAPSDRWPKCHSAAMRQDDTDVKGFVGRHPAVLEAVALIRVGATSLGTGFMLQGAFVTTSHGLGEILDRTAGALSIPGTPEIRIRFAAPQDREVVVPPGTRVSRVKGHDAIAFLVPGLAVRGLEMASARAQEKVLVVGFPLASGEETPSSTLGAIFGDCSGSVPWGRVSLAPGVVVSESASQVAYSANTYRGNSGSPVVRQAGGQLVAMHTEEGELNVSNRGVSSAVLTELLKSLDPLRH